MRANDCVQMEGAAMKIKLRGNQVIVMDHIGSIIIRSIAATPLEAIQQLLAATTPTKDAR